MIKIDRNVPLPNGGTGLGRKYPYAEMKVGDSFFVPGRKDASGLNIGKYGKLLNAKFTARAVDGGMRVWRIE